MINLSEIADILSQSDRFAILSHMNPDGDAVGSVLGMYLALKEMGKTAWALTDEPFPRLYDFLPASAAVIPRGKQSEITPDWIICLDVAAQDRTCVDIRSLGNRARVINIDHHVTNPGYGHVNVVDAGATSTAEIVHRVLKTCGHQLSVEVAKCLYTGLVTDTGCFRFAGVGEKTMQIAAELLQPGVDSYEVTRFLYEEYPIHRMELEKLLLSRVELRLKGILALSHLHYIDFQALGAPLSDGENLVDRLRENHGVEVGMLLTQVSDDVVRASFRSKGLVDVSAIAGIFGGGGHRSAAGLRCSIPLPVLKEQVVEEVRRHLESLPHSG